MNCHNKSLQQLWNEVNQKTAGKTANKQFSNSSVWNQINGQICNHIFLQIQSKIEEMKFGS